MSSVAPGMKGRICEVVRCSYFLLTVSDALPINRLRQYHPPTTSRCVTILIWLPKPIAQNAAALAERSTISADVLPVPAISKITMFVTTLSTSIAMPGISARPSASRFAFSWSSCKLFGPVFEGDQTGGREDADLPHSAAEAFSPDAGFFDKILCPEQDRSCRCAEAFREREHYRIAMAREIGDDVRGRLPR